MKPDDCRQSRMTWGAHRGHNRHARVHRKVAGWMRSKLVALSLSCHRNGGIAKLRYCTFQEQIKPGDCWQFRITWGAHCRHNRHARVTRKVSTLMRSKLAALSLSSHGNGGIAKLRFCTFQEQIKPGNCRQSRITWGAHRGHNRHARVHHQVPRWMRSKLAALSLSSHRNGEIAKLRYCTFQEQIKPGDCWQSRITWAARCGHNRHGRVNRKFPTSMRCKLIAQSLSSHRNGGIVKLQYCTSQEQIKPGDCRQSRITWAARCGHNRHARVNRKFPTSMRCKLIAQSPSSHRNGGIVKLQHCTSQERIKPDHCWQSRITWGAHRGHNRHARVNRKFPMSMRCKLIALSLSSHRDGGIAKLPYCTFQDQIKPGDCWHSRIT
jgi:hypothetical protein